MSLFKIYGITYFVFFLTCIIACWFVPTHIFPSEMSELTDSDLQSMMFNTDFIETEFARPLSHYLLMLATLSFIWLPSIFLIRLQKINKIWFIHFLLLCLTTGFILFMNADFFGEVIYETDLYIGCATPVIKYAWYEEIITNNLPYWTYEVINGYVLIGFLCLIISYIMLLVLSSNKFKISSKI